MNPNNPPVNDNRVAIPDNREDNAEPILAFPSISRNGPNLQNAPLLPAGSSLTSPAGSQGSLNVNLRQPRNLQGLLKFAMEATRMEDVSGTANRAPMDEPRRKFLENALKSLTVNVTEVMNHAIKVLTNRKILDSIKEGDALPDEVRNSFTIILDYVEELDVSNDFFKMGGFAIFPLCYGSQNPELRSRAYSVLGTVCQNNPYCQEKAMRAGLLPVLLNLVQTEQGIALHKCLYALSCFCRGCDQAYLELVELGGCSILVEILTSSDRPARTKAAFIISFFCEVYVDAIKHFLDLNIVEVVAGELQAGWNEGTEHLLCILEVLLRTKDPAIMRMCREPKLNLKNALEDLLKTPELRGDRFAQEKKCCQELLTEIFIKCVEQADR